MPTLPVEEMKIVEVAWAAFESSPTMNFPLVRGNVTTAGDAPIIEGLLEIEIKLLVEVSDEVATSPIKAGVPFVVVKYANLPAVAFVDVPTLLLKVSQLADERHPAAEAEAVVQPTVKPEPIIL